MIDIAVSSLNSCSHFCGSLVVWTSHYDMVGLWLCKNHDSCSMAQSVFLLVAMGSSHQDPSFSSIAMIAQSLLSMKTMRWRVCTSSMLLSGSESSGCPWYFQFPVAMMGSQHQLVAAAMRSQSAYSVAEAMRDQQCCPTTAYYAELWWERREERRQLWRDPVIQK
jgi:hypothetical protein